VTDGCPPRRGPAASGCPPLRLFWRGLRGARAALGLRRQALCTAAAQAPQEAETPCRLPFLPFFLLAKKNPSIEASRANSTRLIYVLARAAMDR
jgi:hypothetical protein